MLIIGATSCRHCSVVWTDHNNQTYENLTVSHEGLTCETCPAGSEPDATHKGCTPCDGRWHDDLQLNIPTFSDGQSHRCKTCGPGKQVDLPGRHQCKDCATLGIHFHSVQGENCQECEYLRGYRPNDARTVCETDDNHFQRHGSILPCKDWAAADRSYGYPAAGAGIRLGIRQKAQE